MGDALALAGGVLAAMHVPELPSAYAAAGAWAERLRLAQEALTLLRGLAADAHTAAATLEDLSATPASLRLCLVTLGVAVPASDQEVSHMRGRHAPTPRQGPSLPCLHGCS